MGADTRVLGVGKGMQLKIVWLKVAQDKLPVAFAQLAMRLTDRSTIF